VLIIARSKNLCTPTNGKKMPNFCSQLLWWELLCFKLIY